MADRYQCASASAQRDEEMLATASNVRAWLLVEVRGAWGVDAIHESSLAAYVPKHWKDELHRRGIRAICTRSQQRADGAGVRLFYVVARRPDEQPAVMWTREVEEFEEVVELAATLDGLPAQRPEGWMVHDQRVLLVCSNGRHDQCCANLGRPLLRELRASPWAAQAWECSHIGGDRFAANLVVLPESLYFGRCAPDVAVELLRALDDGRIDLAHFRGRTRYSLAEQAVEHFVRRETGVEGIADVVVGARRDDGAFAVRLAGDGERVVLVRRSMVSIAAPLTCKGAAGQLVPRFSLMSMS